MLPILQIFLCRLDVSTKVSILSSFLRIGHVVECRFFFELEEIIKRLLADFAGVYGREYGTAWLASMTTVLIAAAGRESDDVGVAVRYAAFSAEDAEFAHSWVVDDQRATVEAYQLTANGRVPPFSSPADRPRFHPFTADQLIDQGAFSNS